MHIYILVLKTTADFLVKQEGSVYLELILGLESLGGSVHLCKQQNVFQENFACLFQMINYLFSFMKKHH